MPALTVQDLIDYYFREAAKRVGQTKLADLIGTKRQGVNAILNRKPGAKFTLDHLSRYITNQKLRTSEFCAELAHLAWRLESQLPKVALPEPASEPTPKLSADVLKMELAEALHDLLQQRRTMTAEEKEEQRRSFVYGNTRLANEAITREMVDRAAESLAAEENRK